MRYKPWFAGLEGAELGRQAVIPSELRQDPTGGLSEDHIRVENADKSVTLLAKTGRQLMIHIYTTLANDEREVFTREVLSATTREEYHRQGLDPALAFDAIKQREDDIIDLFNAIPYGENTPGVFLRPQGGKAFRVEASGLARTNLSIVAIDMVMERGNWKLRWFVPGPGERAIAGVPEGSDRRMGAPGAKP